MTAPKINVKEVDLSTRVPGFLGTYGGIVIPAPKGEVGVPRFITSDSDLLKYFTPNETVEVGYNMAFYSALAFLTKAQRLWVVRADNNSTYGGIIIKDNTKTNIALTSVQVGEVIAVDQLTNKFTVEGDVEALLKLNDKIKLQGSVGNSGIYTIQDATLVGADTEIIVTETILADTIGGIFYRNSIVNPEVYEFGTDDLILITGKNQGSWANDIEIKLYTYAESPDKVKEPNAFLIEVYKDSTGVLLETFLCSRNNNAKDGYGNNIYVEDAVKGSNYIQVIDNTAIPNTVQIKQQTSALQLQGATDGEAVTDTDMIKALNKLNNKSEIPLTLIMDGGWTTPAYQIQIDAISKFRMDCVGILSTPYYVEDSSSYITDIVNYRKTILNVNSSYSALYTPHLKIRDRFNNREIFVAPDGYSAGAISETSSNSEIWFAPAGFRRGILSVMDTKRRFTEGELDLLYDSGVNPVRFAVGKGIAIWGQKTLSSRPSALDRLNVRLLLITIEPAISSFLEDFLFEFNDELTRLLIKSGIESYMDGIQARRGVYDYQVICDESNNTPNDIDDNKLNVHLFVQPTKTAEFIQLSVVITRTGFDISSLQGLVG